MSLGLQGDQSSQVWSRVDQTSQPWIFIGRNGAEAEAPMLWPPDAKSQLVKKDPDAGKDWRQKGKGVEEEEMVDIITNSMDMNLSKLREIAKDRGTRRVQSMASQRVRHSLATEQQQTKAQAYTTFLTEHRDIDSVSLYLRYALHFSEQDLKITNRKQEIIYLFYYLVLLLLLSNCKLWNSKYPFPHSWEKLHTLLFNSWVFLSITALAALLILHNPSV